ncbi:hypothetical protein PHMEG_00034700 [Phytophthora megakarya]|uniref:Uncharacterized protein n=1 Tax=Phytophthora megakarya TaxID=4795 RepID=A0A225US13_9STRA|nr:hypothetical protein PHMEG_00034700 [Phytophthora megakarya]
MAIRNRPGAASENFFDFVRKDTGNLPVTTRLQARSKPKRVRFADETSVTGGEDVAQREEANVLRGEESLCASEPPRVSGPERALYAKG